MNSISNTELILFIVTITAFTAFMFLYSYKWVRFRIVIPKRHYRSWTFLIDLGLLVTVFCLPSLKPHFSKIPQVLSRPMYFPF